MQAGIPFEMPQVFNGGSVEDAFHGTSAQRADAILSKGFRPGTSPDLYGAGTYFFEGDYQAACWWARDHEKVRDPVVLRARVALGRTLYLNFIVEALGKLQVALEARLNRKLEPKHAYAVLQARLRRDNVVQSFKVVRAFTQERKYYRGKSRRAEVIIVVWDPAQIAVQESFTPRQLERKVTLNL
jgi:hypothetical protein